MQQRPFDFPVETQTYIRVSPERVFDALTTASDWDQWFTTGMTLEPKRGGAIHFRWKNWGPDQVTAEDRGSVLEAARASLFVFQWTPVHGSPPTTVEMTIEPRWDGTILRLRENGYPDTPEGRKAILAAATGWGEALTLLKFYLEHGVTYPKEPATAASLA